MALSPCCCISPRTGALTIGILKIIIYVVGIIFSAVAINYVSKTFHTLERNKNYYQDHVLASTFVQVYARFAILVIMMVTCIVGLVLSSILVHGITKEIPRLLKVYLILYGVVFGLSAVGTVVGFIIMPTTILYILLELLYYFVDFYFLVVVYYAFVEVRNSVLHV